MHLRPVFACAIVVLFCAGCDRSSGTPISPSPNIDAATTPAPATSALKVESAAIIEFRYDGQPERWLYAPQLRVTELSGRGPAVITGAEISIPGHSAWVCETTQTVSAGETIELFAEMYGDYALSFEKAGHRSSGSALIVLYGQHGELSVIVPITPGELPTSYTGGRGSPWSSCRARG